MKMRSLLNNFRVALLLLVGLAVLTACGGKIGGKVEGEELYTPKYAKQFVIESYGSSSILRVFNPWQGAKEVEKTLFIEREGSPAPSNFKGAVVKSPLKSVVCMSSSYIAFLQELGEIDVVKAVSGGRFITNPTIQQRYQKGEVKDVGHDSNLNYEMVIALDPDLVLIYGTTGEDNAVVNKLDRLEIPYMYISDYLEESPLGRAEWLVAFGEMFDKREEAEGKFRTIANSYNELEKKVKSSLVAEGEKKPLVMLNAPFRDTWFMPGDRSYMVKLIVDAGGVYAAKGVDSESSRPVSIESAFVLASESDIWLNPGSVDTMEELLSLNPRFSEVPAVVESKVFNNNARTTGQGGSDFWESGAVRPDIVLSDMVKIIHPELLPEYELFYFKEIK